MIGNLLYHFDRALFGLLVPFLAPVFFPQKDQIYALILLYAITPLSLFAKPVGAIVFGQIGDRFGTQKALSITLFGMAIKTGLMGFLPTYAQVGVLSPLLLAMIRLMISFFSAGETTGGAIMLFESSSQNKRNLMSSLYDASGILGILFASLSIWLLNSYENFWRALFWSGSLIGALGWLLRKPVSQKPIKKTAFDNAPLQTLWENRKLVMKIASLAGFSYGNYYLITNFMNGFLPLVSKISISEAVGLNTALLFLDFLLLPIFGMISQKIKKETLILVSIVTIVFSSAPLFYLLQNATVLNATFVRIYLMIFGVIIAAPYHAFVYNISPQKHRYLIGAFSTALGGRLLGSPILSIGLWLYHKTNLVVAPTFPIIIVGIIAFAFLRKELLGEKNKLSNQIQN